MPFSVCRSHVTEHYLIQRCSGRAPTPDKGLVSQRVVLMLHATAHLFGEFLMLCRSYITGDELMQRRIGRAPAPDKGIGSKSVALMLDAAEEIGRNFTEDFQLLNNIPFRRCVLLHQCMHIGLDAQEQYSLQQASFCTELSMLVLSPSCMHACWLHIDRVTQVIPSSLMYEISIGTCILGTSWSETGLGFRVNSLTARNNSCLDSRRHLSHKTSPQKPRLPVSPAM